MSDFAAAKTALAAALQGLTGVNPDGSRASLTVYPRLPGQINVPAAVIAPGGGAFLTYGTSVESDDLTLEITVFVQRGQDRSTTDLLDQFVARSGGLSINGAVEADPTLGGAVDSAQVLQAKDWGVWTFGEISYLGLVFTVEVLM